MAAKMRMSVLLAKIGIAACAVGVVLGAAGIGGYRLQLLTLFPAIGGYAGSVLALAVAAPVMLVAMIGSRGRLGSWAFNSAAWIALVLCVCMTLNNLLWFRQAQVSPAINDISTDMENPPAFEALLPLRASAPSPPEYAGEAVARQQRAAYPEIQPLFIEASVTEAVQLAHQTAQELGWQVVAVAPDAGRVEAVDTTPWFGFKDDVVVRVTLEEGGVTVDVRSKSRVDMADLGTNARRIRYFLAALRAAAS
ncbi:DUF1499 domain-containing protein [Candidatus Foliamicus sp.]